jgi:hypothetical protein
MFGDIQPGAKEQLVAALSDTQEIPIRLIARAVVELDHKLEAIAKATLQSVTALAEATMSISAKQKFASALDRALRQAGG